MKKKTREITGSLQIKNGKYCIVLNLYDKDNVRKQKWISTNVKVGDTESKKLKSRDKACKLLVQAISEYEKTKKNGMLGKDISIDDFIDKYLEILTNRVKANTYNFYIDMIDKHIKPYFAQLDLTLQELGIQDIQNYYNKKCNILSANTVIKHHAFIHQMLDYAVSIDLIPKNPSDYVKLPRKVKFNPVSYDVKNILNLFNIALDSSIKDVIFITAFMGLRRSEVLGLQWSSINLEDKTMTISRTAVKNKSEVLYSDTTKTNSSHRTLVIPDFLLCYLMNLKKEQEANKIYFGTEYIDSDYVCKRADGSLFKPDYISHTFHSLIIKNQLIPIRFHDLRHFSASYLLYRGVTMKEIQEFLGHSSINTTSDIYAHLDFSSKIDIAKKMNDISTKEISF